MKKENFNDKTIAELKKILKDSQKGLFDLRVENAQRKLKNIKSINAKKKELARIKTAMRVKELTDAR